MMYMMLVCEYFSVTVRCDNVFQSRTLVLFTTQYVRKTYTAPPVIMMTGGAVYVLRTYCVVNNTRVRDWKTLSHLTVTEKYSHTSIIYIIYTLVLFTTHHIYHTIEETTETRMLVWEYFSVTNSRVIYHTTYLPHNRGDDGDKDAGMRCCICIAYISYTVYPSIHPSIHPTIQRK